MHLPPRPASDSLRHRILAPTPAPPRSSSANSGRLNKTLPPLPSRCSSLTSLRRPCPDFTPPKISRSASEEGMSPSKGFLEVEPSAAPTPTTFAQIERSKGLRDPDTIRQALGLVSQPRSPGTATQQAVYERVKTVLSDLQEEYTEKLDALLRQAQVDAAAMLQPTSGKGPILENAMVTRNGVQPNSPSVSSQKHVQLLGKNSTSAEDLHQTVEDPLRIGDAISERSELELPAAQENLLFSVPSHVDQFAPSNPESDDMESLDVDDIAKPMDHLGVSMNPVHQPYGASTSEISVVDPAPAGTALQAPGKVHKSRKKDGASKRTKKSEHGNATVNHYASSEHESDDMELADGSTPFVEHVGASIFTARAPHEAEKHETSELLSRQASSSAHETSEARSCKGQKPRTKVGALKRAKRSKHRDGRDGIVCLKSVQFEGCTAVRCATTVRDEVWTADWSGKVHIRDRDDVHKIKDELPFAGLVWCLLAVRARLTMVWIGRENTGICVFDARSREQLCTLTGGHSGSVIAFASADGPGGSVHIWSSSNDFSIRCWHVEAGKGNGGALALPVTPPLQIRRGSVYHGHKNSVRCLLRVGPSLWSGSDDKSICLWKCADGERQEVIEEAHDAGVVCLVIAGRGVWSSGYDGRIREWTIGGERRSCIREITIGHNEPLRTLLPIGRHIWVCGKSKNITIYSEDMEQVDVLEGHTSFISSLCLVDQVETRTIWSSSLGDHSLKVWRHTLRDTGTSVAELAAAKKLYEEESWAASEKLQAAESAAEAAKSELLLASQEFSKQLEEALCRAAEAAEARAAAEALQTAAGKSETVMRAKFLAMQANWEATEAARVLAETQAGECMAAREAAQADLKQSNQALVEAQQETQRLRATVAAQSSQLADLQRRLASSESNLESETSGSQDLQNRLEASEAEARRALEAFAQECHRSTELESLLAEMNSRASRFEQDLGQACERERMLQLKYAELDIFKLDVIARELKIIDRQIDTLRGETRSFLEAAKKFANVSDQQTSINCASSLTEHASKSRGHIRDVIERCLSETQKFHIGAPLQDPTAAGVLQDGGKISGYVVVGEERPVDPPTKGHPRQQDEVRRERRAPA